MSQGLSKRPLNLLVIIPPCWPLLSFLVGSVAILSLAVATWSWVASSSTSWFSFDPLGHFWFHSICSLIPWSSSVPHPLGISAGAQLRFQGPPAVACAAGQQRQQYQWQFPFWVVELDCLQMIVQWLSDCGGYNFHDFQVSVGSCGSSSCKRLSCEQKWSYEQSITWLRKKNIPIFHQPWLGSMSSWDMNHS